MDDAQLKAGLEELGIDEDSWRLVALLPLVQVAWADGEIQPMERRIILGVAQTRGLAEGAGLAKLQGWLTDRPSAEAFHTARELFKGLATGLGDEGTGLLGEIVAFSEGVAQAAGGLFGEDPVTDPERDALQEITTMLGVEDSPSWAELCEDLGL